MGIRGPKPTPTAKAKVLNFPSHSRKKNPKEAVPASALPTAPAHLIDEAKKEWDRVSEELYRAGLLSVLDRAVLAAYCEVYGRWVQAEDVLLGMAKSDPAYRGLMIETTNGNLIQNPMVGTANKAMQDMVKYAEQFGMTPSARSRIQANPPEEDADNPAAKFFTH